MLVSSNSLYFRGLSLAIHCILDDFMLLMVFGLSTLQKSLKLPIVDGTWSTFLNLREF